jgi:hypothetical protein
MFEPISFLGNYIASVALPTVICGFADSGRASLFNVTATCAMGVVKH